VLRVYPTPEAAARGELPEPFAQALAITYSPDGRHTLVLIGCNDRSNPDPCQVLCRRDGAEDRWIEGASTNVPGWTALDDEKERGVFSAWGPRPLRHARSAGPASLPRSRRRLTCGVAKLTRRPTTSQPRQAVARYSAGRRAGVPNGPA
jgi:hypothetical protein